MMLICQEQCYTVVVLGCFQEKSLRKIPQFHLICWCGDFVQRHSFRIASGDWPKLCGSCAFLQDFHTRKLGEIKVFYAVSNNFRHVLGVFSILVGFQVTCYIVFFVRPSFSNNIKILFVCNKWLAAHRCRASIE